jgi:peptide/nickel transport system permease protein
MLLHLAKRGVAQLSLLVAAAVAIFLLLRPLIAEAPAGTPLPAPVETLVVGMPARLGIEMPVLAQLARWIAALLAGDLGHSISADAAIADLLRVRLSVTLHLVAASLAMALALALPAGLIAAARPYGLVDRLARGLAFLAQAAPMAGVALVPMLVFAILLRWLPAGGHVDPATEPTRAMAHLLLPAATLAIGLLPILLRTLRDGARDARRERHLLLARAFGASPRAVAWGRVSRLALVSALTALAPIAAQALSGAILVEAIFELPGLGRLVIESIAARDYVLLRALALASAVALAATALVGDLLRGLLDRRVRSAA